jgi:hypothetical protein
MKYREWIYIGERDRRRRFTFTLHCQLSLAEGSSASEREDLDGGEPDP